MLEAIARGTDTSDKNSDRMQEIMMRHQLGARRMLHFLTSRVAHTRGDLLTVAKGVGIIYAPSGLIIISFFSAGIEEPCGEFEDGSAASRNRS